MTEEQRDFWKAVFIAAIAANNNIETAAAIAWRSVDYIPENKPRQEGT